MFRVGLLAALRSKKLGGKTIGVMVTASHNPEKVRLSGLAPRRRPLTPSTFRLQDNGVKLVDPMGEMLHSSWEAYATLLANALSDDALIATLKQVVQTAEIDLSKPAKVVYGYDTRPSCRTLVRAVADGLSSLDVEQVNAGLVTTPQLHYLTRCLNTEGTPEAYGEPTIEGYYKKLAAAYTTLAVRPPSNLRSIKSRTKLHRDRKSQKGRHLLPALTVDCANGVGAPKLKEFIKIIGQDILPVIPVRDHINLAGQLNLNCGADYVKTQQRAPKNVDLVPWQRYCSFDGDADRIVYYYADGEGTFHLLDGDKIAGLAAGFIMDLVKDAGLGVKVGVVQTAYANGASTKYLTEVLVSTAKPFSIREPDKLIRAPRRAFP